MTRRVAPTLHEFMVGMKASADYACEPCPEWTEYKALLAVVRAARASGVASDCECDEHRRLRKALARLDWSSK